MAIAFTYIMVPFAFLAWGLIHKGHHFALIMSSAVCLSFVSKRLPLRIYGVYLCCWTLFLFITGLNDMSALKIAYPSIGICIFYVVAIGIYVAILKNDLPDTVFFNAICVGAIMQLVVAASQNIGFDPCTWAVEFLTKTDKSIPQKMAGTLGNPNFIAGYLAISIPFFLRARWIKFIVPIVFILLFLRSSCGIATAAAALAVYYRPKAVYLATGIAVCAIFVWFDWTSIAISPRWDMWSDVISRTVSGGPLHILFGYGPGANTGYTCPVHNEYIETFFNMGLCGVGLVIWMIVSSWRSNRVLFSALIAAVVNCLGNYPMHLSPSAFLIIAILALIERQKGAQCQSPT